MTNTIKNTVSIYRILNIALVAAMVLLLVLAIMLREWSTTIGIVSRMVLVVFTFVNCVWLFRVRRSIFGGILLLIVGIATLITALMGYGFNGHPPQPWLF